MTALIHHTIEILVNGKPHCLVDVPAFEGDDPAKSERRAFWTMVSSEVAEPEEITARFAPELAEEAS